jgi:capsular exopolysaccharide synthesis family protein
LADQGFAHILWRGKWFVLAAVGAGIALALLATSLSTKIYEAQATIQVNAGVAAGNNSTSPSDIVNANQGLAQTYATLITDRSFLQKIRPHVLHGRLTTSELAADLSAHAVQNTSLVQLAAQATSPTEARAIAGSVAQAFLQSVQLDSVQRTNALQSQVQSRIHQLDVRIAAGGSGQSLASLRGARAELEKQLAALVAGQIAAGASVSLAGPPTGSSSPVKPRPILNLVAGILVGLLLGCLLAWLRTALDRGLHSGEEAERLLGAPTLARIPERRRFASDDPVLGEAYDVLRANLTFLSTEQPLKVLTVTSFNPREGKSSTVEGLAMAGVRSGLEVLMIDGDVRTRSLSTRLGYGHAPGLTTLIVGLSTEEDAVVEVAPGLSLLPGGPLPPNPPSLLASKQMRSLVEKLGTRYDLVLIDSPPVEHLADASILASISDGVIAVARVGVTLRADLPAAAANLRQVPTPLIGVVLLEPREIDDTYYPAVARGARRVPTSVDDEPDDESTRQPDAVESH